MPERCVAARCDNVNDPENNISLHRIPFFWQNMPDKKEEMKPVGKLRPRKKKELGAGENLLAVFCAFSRR